MKKIFKGRPIVPGEVSGPCVTKKEGLNILETYLNNQDAIRGAMVCIPASIGSTTGGLLLQTTIREGTAPRALLFSNLMDPITAAGVVLAQVWSDKTMVAIDDLGDDFLTAAKDGMTISITFDGHVELKDNSELKPF